ncbi:MAG TPA: MarR family transcriptional regulator [Galbitalea sp.]|nr:MarR family transcriptional regulator [Galbitalea sp.]
MTRTSPDADDVRLLETATELRVLIAKLRRRLAEQASPGDFTPAQASVLSRLLADGPATLTVLAKAEGMRPQSMSAIISVLQADGVIVGQPDPADGRQTILSLSDSARETVEAARVIKNDWLFRSMKAKLTAAEQRQLANGIELLQRLIAP